MGVGGVKGEERGGGGFEGKDLALTPYLFVNCEASTFEVVWSFRKILDWFSFQSV